MTKAKTKAKPKTKRRVGKSTIPKKTLEKAIEGSGGIIQQIAIKVGKAWHTVDDAIKKYKLEANIEWEKEKNLDLAETQIVRSMQSGDTQTCKWYLATKGKKRGYVERQEVDNLQQRAEIDALRAHINAMIINGKAKPTTTNIPGNSTDGAPGDK